MKPEDIVALRKELRCTPRELGDALGVPAKVVMDWEADERFPTKRYIDAMQQLRERGKAAIVRKRGRPRDDASPMKLLADPELWSVFRKLLAHPELRDAVLKMAAGYDDPE